MVPLLSLSRTLFLVLATALLAESSLAFSSTAAGKANDVAISSRIDTIRATSYNARRRRTTTTAAAKVTTATSSSAASAPVERVAIVGAGVAGLSLAHALRSANLRNDSNDDDDIQIDIFDSRAELDERSGSGIQLTGGMAALRRISPELQRAVSGAALPFERVVSRCRPWFGSGNEGGWKLLELDIREEIRQQAGEDDDRISLGDDEDEQGDGDRYGLVTEEGEVLAYTILRGTLQRILQEGLSKEHGVEVQFDKRLSDISYSESNNPPEGEEEGITCQFADGSKTGPYDLVIGCDGIKSAVRQFVNSGRVSQKGSKEDSSAIYSGLRITFAIQERSEDEDAENAIEACQFTQFFGSGAYALTSSYGTGEGKPPAKGAFLVYADENYIGPFPKPKSDDNGAVSSSKAMTAAASDAADPAPLDENPDWTQDKRTSREHVAECLKILQSASVPGNDVADIIERSDRFFDLGVYLHNPFSWNGWVREVPRSGSGGGLFGGGGEKTAKYAVTAGDAAHAMPPFLGQGANQALQDSCSLAAKIHEYNSQVRRPRAVADLSSEPDLKALLQEYENRRWLPTFSITAKSAILGYLEIGPSIVANFRDALFFVLGKLGIAKKVFLDAATPKM